MSEAEKDRALGYGIREYKRLSDEIGSLRLDLDRHADTLRYVTEFIRKEISGEKHLDLADYPTPERLTALIDQIRDLVNRQDELHGALKAQGHTPR